MDGLDGIDWTVFTAYLVAIFGLSVYLARGQRDNEEYFVGSRRMNWMAVGVSLFATAFSSISFVALPREGAYEDYHLLVTYLCIPLVITPLLWWLFVPVYRRLGVTSVYEYLEVRFHPRMRRLGTLLFALYAVGWMGSMVYATGLILKAMLHLSQWQFIWTLIAVGLFATLYTALGGIKAVIWTDVLQAATLGGGMVLVLVLALGRIEGGWEGVRSLGVEHGKFDMFDLDIDFTQRATFFAAVASGLFVYLPGYAVSQVTVQRYLCVERLSDARRALAINAVVAAVVALLFFAVGSTLFAFYHQTGARGFPELEKPDQLMPHFVLSVLRCSGLSGLLLAGLFAAVMSTIDSGINSLTAVVVYDWLPGRNVSVRSSRLLCFTFGVAVVVAALCAPLLGEHVIDIIAVVAGSFLGLLLGVYLIGLLLPWGNTGGATVGLVAGTASLTIVWIGTEITGWWYGAFTCVPVVVAGAVASCCFPRPRPEQLRGLAFFSARRESP